MNRQRSNQKELDALLGPVDATKVRKRFDDANAVPENTARQMRALFFGLISFFLLMQVLISAIFMYRGDGLHLNFGLLFAPIMVVFSRVAAKSARDLVRDTRFIVALKGTVPHHSDECYTALVESLLSNRQKETLAVLAPEFNGTVFELLETVRGLDPEPEGVL